MGAISSGKGIKPAIDDFGTGHSILAYLQALPAGAVTIDQTCVRKLIADEREQMLVKAMVALSDDLGHRVVAEGGETGEALSFLKSIGCDEAQVYLFARPACHLTPSWDGLAASEAPDARPFLARCLSLGHSPGRPVSGQRPGSQARRPGRPGSGHIPATFQRDC